MNLIRKAAAIAVLWGALAAVPASAFVLGPTSPGKWGSPTMGTGATVTYSFMADGTSCAGECSTSITSLDTLFNSLGISDADWMGAVLAAFAAWSAVADITFVEVADLGEAFNAATQLSGDIRLGAHTFDGPGGTLAHGYFPPVNGASAAGDIHFDIAETWKVGFGGPGFDIFQVMAHEIGHAIGLDHTGVPNSLMNPFYTEAFLGLQADDIAGAQFIYGARQEVPEPGIAALFAVGLLGAAFGSARRRRS